MAKAKKKVHKKRQMTISLSIIAGLLPVGGKLLEHFQNPSLHGQSNGLSAMGVEGSRILTGIDPRTGQFNMGWLWLGLFPMIGGVLVHKFIGGKLGLNKAIAGTGLPFIRL